MFNFHLMEIPLRLKSVANAVFSNPGSSSILYLLLSQHYCLSYVLYSINVSINFLGLLNTGFVIEVVLALYLYENVSPHLPMQSYPVLQEIEPGLENTALATPILFHSI